MKFHRVLLVLTIFIVTFLVPNLSKTTNFLASTNAFKDFFSQTYLERMTAPWDAKKNRYQPLGYSPGWEMFHIHHMCVRGGTDGIFVGIEGVENSWTDKAKYNKNIMNAMEWQKYAKSRGLFAFFMKRVIASTKSTNVTMTHGSTWLMNCFHQRAASFNPAHWLMKLGVWYEVSACMFNNGKTNIFRNNITLPYNHVQMLQCSSPELHDWKWGASLFSIVKARSDLAGMTGSTTTYANVGYEIDADESKMLCFEDVYFSARMGLWMQGRRNLVEFRKDAATVTSEPAAALKTPEKLMLNDKGFDETEQTLSRMPYCSPAGSVPPTSARIKIFKRTMTVMLRRFINFDEVVNLVQSYTSNKVEVITVNESTTIQEQIREFNSFDILITSHGSHLANGIFTMNPESKAVVEIVPFVFDSVFYGNYNRWLNFSDYVFSSGHLTPALSVHGRDCPFRAPDGFDKRNCSLVLQSYPTKLEQHWVMCDAAFHTRKCDTLVDIKMLKAHMDLLITHALCKP